MQRRTFLRAGLALAATGRGRRAHAVPSPARPTRIYVQPMGGELPDADVALVVRALAALLGVDVAVRARVALPARAYYPPRKRYRAERLLIFLNTQLPDDGAHILGLTAADISTTKDKIKDWGVLGLGQMPGTACVISTFRCGKRARDAQHARERLAKVAVHEIGHTLGLDHCPAHGCLMEDAAGKVVTSDREYDFCARCRERLAVAGRPLPEAPDIPWPRPR